MYNINIFLCTEPTETKKQEKEEEEDKKLGVEENEAEQKRKMEEEKRREKKRKQHIRPWDKGKESMKEHRVYTQEEWVEKKRKERPTEFAPPTSFRKRSLDEDKLETYEDKSLYFSTKKSDNKNESSKRGLNPYKRRNISPETRTPIVNELSDDDDYHRKKSNKCDEDSDSDRESRRGKGVEIAPPPTFDYYGPSSSKRHNKLEKRKENIEDSITAGLNYLRKQTEQKQRPHKRDDDMFIM